MLSLFYRDVRLLILCLVLIVVWGVSSYVSLPILEDPELVSRVAIVRTFLPGATADRVEALVTEKIEQQLTAIKEIDTYESTSRSGSSIITVDLLESVTASEVDGIWSKVRDKLRNAEAEFPQGTTTPDLDEVDIKAYALVAALGWDQDDFPNYAILRRLAESLTDRLQAVAGTESVDVFGDPDEEVLVQVDASKLASLGLTVAEVSRQIRQSDAKDSAGQLRARDNQLLLEVRGELTSLEQLRQRPIQYGSAGQFVYLGDIAQVSKGTVEPLTEQAIASGRVAITLGVFVRSDYRLDRWAGQARQVLAEFRDQLPVGITLDSLFDQSRYVTARLHSLVNNLLMGAALVFLVTLVMLGWQAALIVGMALPLSLFMVFGFMKVLGIPLHQMSVTGLIVALGILIDTAIVMVDDVRQHLMRGIPASQAINQSGRQLALPLLASTITTVLAFMPIALLPGSVGEFVGTIGVNVIIAISCSLVLSMTVIPALAAHLYEAMSRRSSADGSPVPTHSGQGALGAWWQQGITLPRLARVYHGWVDRILRRPLVTIAVAMVVPLVGFLMAPHLEQQFFPPADRDQVQIELELSASAPLAQTEAITQRLRDRLIQFPQVEDVHWFIGTNAPRFYYNLTGGRSNEANYAQALVQLNTLASSEFTQTLQQTLTQAFSASRIVVRQLEQGPPFDAPIELRLYGDDVEQLQQLGEQLRSTLVQVEGITLTRSTLNDVVPQLSLDLSEEEARLAGLDYSTIAQQLAQTLEGAEGGSILEDTEELPVRVRLSNRDRADLNQISSLPLLGQASNAATSAATSTRDPTWVPLNTLGEVTLTPKLAKITRRDGQRVNTIQGFVQAGILPSVVLEQFQQRLQDDNWQLPAGYTLELGGEAEERASAIGNLVSTVGVLVILTIATLVLSLGAFNLAGLIGVVAVASFGLGLFSVGIFGYPFGFNPIIGTVGLIGVAINDSIVVLSSLNDHPQARLGDRAAIRDVVLHSTRHVLATTFTTMIGFVPLLIGGGGFWPPMAIAIAGGVGGATLLALFFIPAAYLMLKRPQQRQLRQLAPSMVNT